jgi:glycosyltransferase involved in cell wall biosynthesis
VGAVRFDAAAAGNRPGWDGLWQRPLERRRLRESPLLLPWSEGALREAGLPSDRALVLPVAIEPSGPGREERDVAAITYAANPRKKGLDRVLEAWRRVGAEGELLVTGTSGPELARAGIAVGERVRVLEGLSTGDYRALVRRARVFVCAPRREDYGIAQLEALADGCRLVTTPAPGPYAALPIARGLDGRLVGEDLVGGLRAALESNRDDYAERALRALAPYRCEAVDRVVAEELVPRLLAQGQ